MWKANRCAAKLRSEALADFLRDWESEHGALTGEELARAATELGFVLEPGQPRT